MKVADRYYIREMNENLVLEIIIQQGTISRADISKLCGLNKATVSSIVTNLLEKELVKEIGIGESSGGRKPIMVTFNEKAALSLSIDLGDNYISSILTYLDGTIILQKNIDDITINKRTVMKELKELITYYLEQAPHTTYGVIGICIGIHGIVNDNQITFAPYYNFEGLNLVENLERVFAIPVRLENEANLSALGEKIFSTNASNFVSISVHTGVGAGIIINDELFRGSKGYGGEIGHMIVIPNGRKCPCGNKGCIEQYASEKRLLEVYRKKKGQKQLTFEQLIYNYKNNEQEALDIVNTFIDYISISVNNIFTAFDPDVFILNSRFTSNIDGLIDSIKDKITNKMNSDTILQSSSLREKATLLGGVHVNSTSFLDIKHFTFQNMSGDKHHLENPN
ncbi:ROK family transcriptional regulator [Bacillus sp. V2I10]|uniref:ROK family transcriptional regulator n=1 Tax=Bacillus sp. V2I10 TaxID=3042276 RepID=UPI0027883B17|nr:ROK family transcriptional regulator [Bacillus sp. V2I10]MDQ0857728.1 putative NBD/HSP70 family sugar kinase [Bacillus sp. V2I10]